MQFDKLMTALGLGEVTDEPCEVKGGLLHKMYKVTATSGVLQAVWQECLGGLSIM